MNVDVSVSVHIYVYVCECVYIDVHICEYDDEHTSVHVRINICVQKNILGRTTAPIIESTTTRTAYDADVQHGMARHGQPNPP